MMMIYLPLWCPARYRSGHLHVLFIMHYPCQYSHLLPFPEPLSLCRRRVHAYARSHSMVKVIEQSLRSEEENITKVVSATSSENFVARLCYQ